MFELLPLLFCVAASVAVFDRTHAPALPSSPVPARTLTPPSTPEEALAVDYLLRVLPGRDLVEVTLDVRGLDPEAETLDLSMIEGFAYVRLERPRLDGDVLARASGGEDAAPLAVEHVSPYLWRVATGGAEAITVSYAVPQDHRTLPEVLGRDEYEYPYLEETHGMLVTGTLLLRPDRRATSARRVRFELPQDWAVHAPWPDHSGGGFAPPSDRALANDLIAVGGWSTRVIEVGAFEVTVAASSHQPDLLEAVAAPLEAIVREELALFGTQPNGRYLVLFGRPDIQGFGGSPKTGSMTLAIREDLVGRMEGAIEHLVAHEFFHTWGQSRAPLPDELRWLNEGVTDYFAYLAPLRAGLIAPEAFERTLLEKLRALEANGARAKLALAAAGGPAFFEGGDAYSLCYDGGLVIGAWLDASLRALDEPTTLIEVLRDFLGDARWDDLGAEPTTADFLAVVAARGGAALAARLRELTSEPLAELDAELLFAEAGVLLEDGESGTPGRIVSGPWRDEAP